jgi:hypothetical protein
MDEPTLGRASRARRRELELTQGELADLVGGGMRQPEVSRLERDGVALPRSGGRPVSCWPTPAGRATPMPPSGRFRRTRRQSWPGCGR